MKGPDEIFGSLYIDVQSSGIFSDSKVFVDAVPRLSAIDIVKAYDHEKLSPNFDLISFVLRYFRIPTESSTGFKSDATKNPEQHVASLWQVLTRESNIVKNEAESIISLPKPYIVPGGRFGEIYYWDSYFTMLGLIEHGHLDMVQNMVDNFAYLIDQLGFIPNGNRTYFISRSQPPFFACMVELLADQNGDDVYIKYQTHLQKEYNFWMERERAVQLSDGEVLNRYWDQKDSPRQESYIEDVELAEKVTSNENLWRHLRGGCESGWDFSGRWLANPMDLSTIQTCDIIPPDLNALIYNLELVLSKSYNKSGELDKSIQFKDKAECRKSLMTKYLWDSDHGHFVDINFVNKEKIDYPSLAMVYPLFFKIATQDQADRTSEVVRSSFLKDGGVVTSLIRTGQQWDAPNGWPPLQWLTVMGLENYGHHDLALEIANRWIASCDRVYEQSGKFVEKYDVMDVNSEAGGGEYPVQDGFGWSNGVYIAMKKYVNQ